MQRVIWPCGRYLLPEWTLDVLRRYPVSEYGELQSIYALRHMIKNGGLNGVVYNTSMSMYDSGTGGLVEIPNPSRTPKR